MTGDSSRVEPFADIRTANLEANNLYSSGQSTDSVYNSPLHVGGRRVASLPETLPRLKRSRLGEIQPREGVSGRAINWRRALWDSGRPTKSASFAITTRTLMRSHSRN